MPVELTTQDCASLSDSEIAEMADLCPPGSGFDVGDVTKQTEEWVLVSRAYRGAALAGFVLSTLERIGGTPALVVGAGSITDGANNRAACQALVHQLFHKVLMAFPDEDVIVSARVAEPRGYVVFEELQDVRPWPGERMGGEDRAWGRRLAKRYGSDAFDERSLIASSMPAPMTFGCHSGKPSHDVSELFADFDARTGKHLLVWGWAVAEFLEELSGPSYK